MRIEARGCMIGACLLMWCLGQDFVPSERVTFTHELLDRPTTQRVFAYEIPWVVAGFVWQTGARNAVFGGALPLTITVFNGYVSLEGGAILASADVPRNGTRANFMAVARVRLTKRVALAYWHWSNAYLAGSNPSVNAVGVSIRLRDR